MKKYKSFTLKQAGWKLDEAGNSITIGKQRYRYAKSREIDGKIKTLTVKRNQMSCGGLSRCPIHRAQTENQIIIGKGMVDFYQVFHEAMYNGIMQHS